MKFYALLMDGDFGQEHAVFSSKEKAKEFASRMYSLHMGEHPDEPFEEFWDSYCHTIELEVDP